MQDAVYQERLGWERPGWFAVNEKAPVSIPVRNLMIKITQ